MASLSHSLLPDYPNKRSCKEATSPAPYPSGNNMQSLYAFMQTLQHPHTQTSPYMQHAKPFYPSSNVQGPSEGTGEKDLFGSRPYHLMEAMESKAFTSSSGEHLNVNVAKKRIRAVMDHKDAEVDRSVKRMKIVSTAEGGAMQEKELPTEVKSSSSYAQEAKGSTFSKFDNDNTEFKSSDIKPTGKAPESPTMDAGSPAASKPDFIHVRARRGQATDSHSLAERVRREKISERMKYLQDLVPGCVKVTGKAMMLDEIINYVQALQRQVEFLSMKLAAVHPSKLEFSLENLFGKKQVEQPNMKDCGIVEQAASMQAFAPTADYQGNIGPSYAVRSTESFGDCMRLHELDANVLQPENQLSCNPAELLANLPSVLGVDDNSLMQRTAAANIGYPSAIDTMLESTYHSCMSQNSQSELDWDDDLQNIVQQMGCFSQTSSYFPPHIQSEGLYAQNHMKTEL